MGIRGHLETMPLADVLQWLSQGNKTGVLVCRSARGVAKRVFFEKGRVLSTASSDPREYLGQFLISRGFLTEEQLNMAMETQLQTGIKLGKILVTVGILDEDDLKAMLRLKAEESLYDLFLWGEGEFHFEDQESISEELIAIQLDVMSLVMEGVRRCDEWGRIRAVVPNGRVVLARTGKRLRDASIEVSTPLLRVYEAVDDRRTVEEVALELHATEFYVSAAAFKLIENGLLRAAGEKQERSEVAYDAIKEKLLDEARRLVEAERYGEAINLLQYAVKSDPQDTGARDLLLQAEESYSEQFFRDTVPLRTVLELAVPLSKLSACDLTPQEGYLATRVNGMWDLESILKVCPLPQPEALRAVKKLLDLKVLKVKGP